MVRAGVEKDQAEQSSQPWCRVAEEERLRLGAEGGGAGDHTAHMATESLRTGPKGNHPAWPVWCSG